MFKIYKRISLVCLLVVISNCKIVRKNIETHNCDNIKIDILENQNDYFNESFELGHKKQKTDLLSEIINYKNTNFSDKNKKRILKVLKIINNIEGKTIRTKAINADFCEVNFKFTDYSFFPDDFSNHIIFKGLNNEVNRQLSKKELANSISTKMSNDTLKTKSKPKYYKGNYFQYKNNLIYESFTFKTYDPEYQWGLYSNFHFFDYDERGLLNFAVIKIDLIDGYFMDNQIKNRFIYYVDRNHLEYNNGTINIWKFEIGKEVDTDLILNIEKSSYAYKEK